ncbi:hypothetical protein PGTUg99_018293 [Puccinia graminis f. sp. tritici]|uniref:Uncharacterized protein n=1 Tax=Puccinia graminis f. sp. tritici TaxID=56615 RepID=A0A5B0S3S6_PUCGR|nr:hypothetical protein PGTUg99_018293 [Puccinia graminis f. sp. tritici]
MAAKYCPDWDYTDLHSSPPEMDLDLKTGILTVYPSLPTVSGTRKDESLTMVQLLKCNAIDQGYTARAREEDACVCQKTQQNSVTKHEPDAPQLELPPVVDVQMNLQPTEEPLANKHDPDASPSESPSIVKVEGDDNQGLKPAM